MECHYYLRDVQDLLTERNTPFGRRFGESFKGPIILFGALVEYHPMSTRDLSRLRQFGKKVLPGKLRMNEEMENLSSKDPLFHLVHWQSTSQIPRETKVEFVNSERTYYQESFKDMP